MKGRREMVNDAERRRLVLSIQLLTATLKLVPFIYSATHPMDPSIGDGIFVEHQFILNHNL